MTEEPRTASAPSKTYHLILQRLAQALDPAVRNVLNMAAVLGGRLNDIDLYTMADVLDGTSHDGPGLADPDLRILRDGGRGLEFCNELVRGVGIPSGTISRAKDTPSRYRRTALRQELKGQRTFPWARDCLGTASGQVGHRGNSLIRFEAPRRRFVGERRIKKAQRALQTGMGTSRSPKARHALLAESLRAGEWELSSLSQSMSSNRWRSS